MRPTFIKLEKIILLLVLLGLMFPILQEKLHLIDNRPLKGAITQTENTYFSIAKWLSGDYQLNKEKYINENFGLRNTFVRINNQLALSLFNKAKANGVIIGKDNYLYEENYIKAYFGKDFLGSPSIDERIMKLKQIADTLKSRNIDLIIVFAPGKGSYYPEYIPEKFHVKKEVTNYEYYTKKINEIGIPFIDFNRYFIQQKYKSPYPLYPKTGIHWSTYGMNIVADSLISYMEELKKIDFPEIYWDNVLLTDSLTEMDMDIETGMNLLFKIPNHKMAYPLLKFREENKKKPKVLTVADSFYWGIYGSGIASRLFQEPQFWYYFKEVHQADGSVAKSIDAVNVKEEIEKHDMVILMVTEANLPQFPWGFIEKMDHIYFSSGGLNNSQRKNKILAYETTIRENKNWLEAVKKKAVEKGIPLDSMIRMDAIYMVDTEK